MNDKPYYFQNKTNSNLFKTFTILKSNHLKRCNCRTLLQDISKEQKNARKIFAENKYNPYCIYTITSDIIQAII